VGDTCHDSWSSKCKQQRCLTSTLTCMVCLLPCCKAQVVAALRALSESRQVWTVRGNNDDVALAAWYKLQAGVPLEELKAKTRWVGQLLPEDVDYMNQMPFSIKVEG
jgi:hypothetical protein